MRRIALLTAFAVTSSSLVGLSSVTALPAQAAGASLKVSNTTPYQGQQVKFTGQLASKPKGPTLVVLQLAGKGWKDVRKVTTTNGRYAFAVGTGSTDPRTFRITVHGSKVASNTVTLRARSNATAPKIAAPKASTVEPFLNARFHLAGKLGTKQARPVYLQRTAGHSWKSVAKATTKSDGSYSFALSTSAASRSWRVYAPAVKYTAPVVSNAVATAAKDNTVGLVLSRLGSTTRIVADGVLSAGKADGRDVELQAAGRGWQKVATKKQANGTVHFTGLKRSTDYRLVARPFQTKKSGVAPQIVSHDERLSFGPKKLGNATGFITTQSGASPKKKGKGYVSTLAINGKSGSLVAAVEEFGIRGNTSATYPKPSYKVKFDDPARPLGLPAGKTFNLVPNYQDRSLLRTAIGIGWVAGNVINRGQEWTPHRHFLEIYINGKYRGVYDLIESVKIEKGSTKGSANRIPVDPTNGVVIEIDPFGKKDSVPYWHSKNSDLPFKFKDPDTKDGTPQGITTAKAKAIKAKVTQFESVLYGKNPYDAKNGWTKYLDMNSAVDFYLAKEFIKDWDGDFYRSNFFYTNNAFDTGTKDPSSKLYLAPVWDVDRSAGAKSTGVSSVMSPKGWWMNGDGGGHLSNSDNVHTRHWLVKISRDKAFQKALRARWVQTKGVFKAAGSTKVDAAVAEMGKVAGNNDWKMWSKTGNTRRYASHTSSFSGETRWVKNWYQARYRWMNSQLG